jgi:hypothetical protein
MHRWGVTYPYSNSLEAEELVLDENDSKEKVSHPHDPDASSHTGTNSFSDSLADTCPNSVADARSYNSDTDRNSHVNVVAIRYSNAYCNAFPIGIVEAVVVACPHPKCQRESVSFSDFNPTATQENRQCLRRGGSDLRCPRHEGPDGTHGVRQASDD